MSTGAVIVAAGLSSRMGQFKPLLPIGALPIARRVVTTFRQAGVDKIAMVTGHNAEALERELADSGVLFLRNEAYASTKMFDSAKIGLRYLKDSCDRILFTPVDIPLFTAGTVRALLSSWAELACPCCQGEMGHPILISSALIDGLLGDSGEGGLKGAISRSGHGMLRVEVPDRGILRDADTPEDYAALLELYDNLQ